MKKLLLITFTLLYNAIAAQTPFTEKNNLSERILTIVYKGVSTCMEDSPRRGEGKDIEPLKEVMKKTNAYDVGTGFVYQHGNEKYIITCFHVVYDGNDVFGYTSDYNTAYELEFVGADYFYDLAIFKFKQSQDAKHFETVELDYSYDTNNDVWAVGYWKPDGTPNVNQGSILMPDKELKEDDLPLELMGYIKSNAPTSGGYSGGVVYNCEGQVVGMNNSARNDEKISYALESKIINRIVRDILNPDTRMVQRAYTGIKFAQDSEGGPVLISDILSHSPAAIYTSRLKDKSVKSINGNAIDNIYDVLNTMEKRQPGDRIILELNTDDADREFYITPELLEKKNLQRIAEHAIQNNPDVRLNEGEVIVLKEQGGILKEKIGTIAGRKYGLVYCLNNVEQFGVIVRKFGLYGKMRIGTSDNIKRDKEDIYFSHNGETMRVLYY